jgi:AraC-like DNA-binding protein
MSPASFVLPDELNGYSPGVDVFFYEHVNTRENNNSKLKFTTHCISIGINGTKALKTSEGVENFAEGDVVFYRPGNYLSYVNYDNEKPYRCLMIFFDAVFFSGIMDKISPDFNTHHKTGIDKVYFSVRAQSYIHNFIQSYQNLTGTNNRFTPALQKVKLLELIYFLAEMSYHQLQSMFQGDISAEDQFNALVEKNIDHNVTLEELAFLCNMSLATFKRLFMKRYGLSPGKWLKQKRLARAAAQIKANVLPKEVFHDAGYADYSSFSHAFKEMFSVSPKEYKNL